MGGATQKGPRPSFGMTTTFQKKKKKIRNFIFRIAGVIPKDERARSCTPVLLLV